MLAGMLGLAVTSTSPLSRHVQEHIEVSSGSGLSVVLLAAGRGSRLAELTDRTHKSLLPIAGRPCLQYALDAILSSRFREVVIVTGYLRDSLHAFVAETYDDSRIKCVPNLSYEQDTNILSVDIGVDALTAPENGYLIVEADIVLEPDGWKRITSLDASGPSLWVTRGSYSRDLTGGALRANDQADVEEIVYAPDYDPSFNGWQKLLGALLVAKPQVSIDRTLRKSAIHKSIQQYYMMPWVSNLARLPCKALPLGALFAYSFNDAGSYRSINSQYARIMERGISS
jgi:CTP:molybdopterin cytidylyltransferase MocA